MSVLNNGALDLSRESTAQTAHTSSSAVTDPSTINGVRLDERHILPASGQNQDGDRDTRVTASAVTSGEVSMFGGRDVSLSDKSSPSVSRRTGNSHTRQSFGRSTANAIGRLLPASVFGVSEEEAAMRRPSRHTNGNSKRMKSAVFADATALKAKVIQNLKKPEYNVFDYYYDTGVCQAIAKSSMFEYITLGVIAFNALWIAIDTDQNKAKVITDAPLVYQVMEHLFCSFFTFEWIVRFASFRRKRDGMRDSWFVFDSALVILMVFETWVMTIIGAIFARDDADGGNNVDIFKLFRLLRLSRVARMARLLRSVPELMILIKGIATAVRSVFGTLVLLMINIYVFAIFFTQLTEDYEVGEIYFGTVWESMYTLLLRGVLLDTPGLVSNALNKESPFFTVLFFIFIMLGALTVMNMLIGVLCEVVGVVASVEKEEMLISFVKSRLQHIVEELDENDDNQISRTEFLKILENRDAAEALNEVGVDVVGLIDFVDHIFDDGSMGPNDEVELTFPDFMEVVLSLRGSNTATVKDVVDLRKFVRNGAQSTASHLSTMGHRMSRIEDSIGTIERLLLNHAVERSRSGSSTNYSSLGRGPKMDKYGLGSRTNHSKGNEDLLVGQVKSDGSDCGFTPEYVFAPETSVEVARVGSSGPGSYGSRKVAPPRSVHPMPIISETARTVTQKLQDHARDRCRSPSRLPEQPRADAGLTPRGIASRPSQESMSGFQSARSGEVGPYIQRQGSQNSDSSGTPYVNIRNSDDAIFNLLPALPDPPDTDEGPAPREGTDV